MDEYNIEELKKECKYKVGNKFPVVIPLIKSKWGEEIRYALRSWEKHFNHDNYQIVIIGNYKPDWFSDELWHIWYNDDPNKRSSYNQGQKLKIVVELFDEFLWSNDDIYLLKDLDLDFFKTPWCLGDLNLIPKSKRIKNEWHKLLWQTYDKMKKLGHYGYNAEIHMPYYYRSDLVRKTQELYKDIWNGENLVRSCYINTEYEQTKFSPRIIRSIISFTGDGFPFVELVDWNRYVLMFHDDFVFKIKPGEKLIQIIKEELFSAPSKYEKKGEI